jgi:hypothetical protein
MLRYIYVISLDYESVVLFYFGLFFIATGALYNIFFHRLICMHEDIDIICKYCKIVYHIFDYLENIEFFVDEIDFLYILIIFFIIKSSDDMNV